MHHVLKSHHNYNLIVFHTAPEDFMAEQIQVTFPANESMACATFTIRDDLVDEVDESFEILFIVPAGVIPPSTNPMVTIIDGELIVFSILFEANIIIQLNKLLTLTSHVIIILTMSASFRSFGISTFSVIFIIFLWPTGPSLSHRFELYIYMFVSLMRVCIVYIVI